MPDAFVFPGGALDAADGAARALARLHAPPDAVNPAFAVAAIRELFEEAGVLLATSASGIPLGVRDEPALTTARGALAQERAFAQLLERHDWYLDGEALALYSHWITPLGQTRRFDTRFFVARVPPGQDALADAVEVHDGAWFAPASALDGTLSIFFPTRKHLERLAEFASVEAALASARARTPFAVMPLVEADGTTTLPDTAW